MTKALSAVNSGTFAAFNSVTVVMGLLCDVFYFKLHLKWNDYLGPAMILIFTILLSISSLNENIDSNSARREELREDQLRQSRENTPDSSAAKSKEETSPLLQQENI